MKKKEKLYFNGQLTKMLFLVENTKFVQNLLIWYLIRGRK